jgi:hypothetical protein
MFQYSNILTTTKILTSQNKIPNTILNDNRINKVDQLEIISLILTDQKKILEPIVDKPNLIILDNKSIDQLKNIIFKINNIHYHLTKSENIKLKKTDVFVKLLV